MDIQSPEYVQEANCPHCGETIALGELKIFDHDKNDMELDSTDVEDIDFIDRETRTATKSIYVCPECETIIS